MRTPVKLSQQLGAPTCATDVADGSVAAPSSQTQLHVIHRRKLTVKRERSESEVPLTNSSGDSLFDDVWCPVVPHEKAALSTTADGDDRTSDGILVEWDLRTDDVDGSSLSKTATTAGGVTRRPLDEDQQRCVTHDVNAPLMILAGAGSGKTQTMAHRVAQLLLCGISPFKILGLSFSRASAEELRRRVAESLPPSLSSQADCLTLKTIHSFCLTLIRRFHPGGRCLNVVDAKACRKIAQRAIMELSGGRSETSGQLFRRDASAVNELLQFVDRTKRKVPDAQGRWPMPPGNPLTDQFYRYQHILHEECNGCDFSDLQLFCLTLLRDQNPRDDLGGLSVSQAVQERYSHVLVDESQDVDEVQYEVLCRVVGDGCRVSCVGDPKQSIYGFRGAMKNFFESFAKRFQLQKELHSRHLTRNYRSVSHIVNVCNAVAAQIYSGGEDCTSVRGAGKEVDDSVLIHHAVDEEGMLTQVGAAIRGLTEGQNAAYSFKDIGILVRIGRMGKDCRLSLQRQGIPARTLMRRDPSASTLLSSLIAHLRCIVDPHRVPNETLLHAMTRPVRIIEKRMESMLLAEQQNRRRDADNRAADGSSLSHTSLFGILEEMVDNQFMVQHHAVPRLLRQKEALTHWVALIRDAHRDLLDSGAAAPPDVIMSVVRRVLEDGGFVSSASLPAASSSSTNQQQASDGEDDDVDVMVEDAAACYDILNETMQNIIATTSEGVESLHIRGCHGLCMMLDTLQTSAAFTDYGDSAAAKKKGIEENCVTVSTVHKAKGLEWPVVFVVDCTEGSMPVMNRETGYVDAEEKRIFYVAISRARDRLELFAQSNGKDKRPSRYIETYLMQNSAALAVKVVR